METKTAPNQAFVDYYEVLQISPNAELETVKRVYKMLAVRLHPDNSSTGYPDRFILLKRAFETLSDPEKRARYDYELSTRSDQPLPVFEMSEFAVGVDGEMNRRIGILCLLYNARRSDEDNPGISILDLEKIMGFPREHLTFTLWYLRDRKYVANSQNSDYAITSDGIDYVEEHLPTNRVAYKLLKGAEDGTARMPNEEPEPRPPVRARTRHGADAVVQ